MYIYIHIYIYIYIYHTYVSIQLVTPETCSIYVRGPLLSFIASIKMWSIRHFQTHPNPWFIGETPGFFDGLIPLFGWLNPVICLLNSPFSIVIISHHIS